MLASVVVLPYSEDEKVVQRGTMLAAWHNRNIVGDARAFWLQLCIGDEAYLLLRMRCSCRVLKSFCY